MKIKLILLNLRTKYPTKKEADEVFLDLTKHILEKRGCIASTLRNAILNLGVIPKVVYQDNGKAFKAKYFHDKQGEFMSRSLTGAKCYFLAKASKNQHYCQHIDFDESGFNGVYASLRIKSVFAKPYNAKCFYIFRNTFYIRLFISKDFNKIKRL